MPIIQAKEAYYAKWSRLDLGDFIDKTRLQPVDDEAIDRLRTAAMTAKTILFLGDNCGESVFDRLLAGQLLPAKIFYAVKGSPVINDVTLSDAPWTGHSSWVLKGEWMMPIGSIRCFIAPPS